MKNHVNEQTPDLESAVFDILSGTIRDAESQRDAFLLSIGSYQSHVLASRSDRVTERQTASPPANSKGRHR